MSNELKAQAAEKAVEKVESGMVLGLGTGSTTYHALVKISKLLKDGSLKNIKGIPSSKQTQKQAEGLGIPLTTLDENPQIDLTIDGADEVDEELHLIKGGGGALLREKVLAQASKYEVIVVDESKLSKHLGEKWKVPIEIIRFSQKSVEKFLESLGAEVHLRHKEGKIFITDEGNIILDADFGIIEYPDELADNLNAKAGIVEHGLFINLADEVISAGENGIKNFQKS
jgi:ribose 5-phosphate isomerase A